jgi:hypothetical protein
MLPDAPLLLPEARPSPLLDPHQISPPTSHDACTTSEPPHPHARGPFHLWISFR